MNRFLFGFTLLLTLSCTQTSKNEQSNSAVKNIVIDTIVADTIRVKQKAVDPILFIREKVTLINTTTLVKKHFEFSCDELTKVDFFYENKELVKISIDFGTIGDVYAKEDYYYDHGKLIFFYEFVEGGPACEGCVKTNEYRSYIKKDKVFKYLKDKKVQVCRKCEFTSKSRQYQLLNAKTEQQVKAIVCR